jgi:LysM repeat protein
MIQYGETLYSISMKYKVTVSEIQNANGMGTSIEIKAGQKLRIPNK